MLLASQDSNQTSYLAEVMTTRRLIKLFRFVFSRVFLARLQMFRSWARSKMQQPMYLLNVNARHEVSRRGSRAWDLSATALWSFLTLFSYTECSVALSSYAYSDI